MGSQRVFDLHTSSLPAQDVRSVALNGAGTRLCLGLAGGVLEEYRVGAGDGRGLTLSATKHLGSNSAVTQLAYVGSASRLLALQESGALHALDAETLRAQPVPLRGAALALAVDESRPRAPRLAVALRPRGARHCRLAVLLLYPAESGRLGQVAADMELPGVGGVRAIAWVGPQVVLVSELRYLIAAPLAPTAPQLRALFAVPPELAYVAPQAAALPALGAALLVLGQAAVRIDAAGRPQGGTLSLEACGAVAAVAGVGRHCLVWSRDAVHVLDAETGRLVQRVGFGAEEGFSDEDDAETIDDDVATAFAAASAGEGGAVLALTRARLPGASSLSSAPRGAAPAPGVESVRIVIAAPVPLREQALAALAAGDADAALRLVDAAGGAGAGAWAPGVTRLAAGRLLREGREAEALRLLERLSPDDFQPSSLFALWPRRMRRWLGGDAGDVGGAGEPGDPGLASAHSLGWERGRAARRGGAPALEPHSSDDEGVAGGESTGSSPPPPLKSRGVAFAETDEPRERREEQDLERREVLGEFVHYFFWAREQEGVRDRDGLDELLMHLLVDLGARDQAAAFASLPSNRAPLEGVERRLLRRGWDDVLATLCAHRGQARRALAIFRRDPGAGEAARTAADLLLDAEACPPALVLEALPWLLGTSAADAMRVLRGRRADLDPERALPLLAPGGALRWRFLTLVLGLEAPTDVRGMLGVLPGRGRGPGVAGDDAETTDDDDLDDSAAAAELRTQLVIELFERLASLVDSLKGTSATEVLEKSSSFSEQLEVRRLLGKILPSRAQLDAARVLDTARFTDRVDRERVELFRRAGRHDDALRTLGQRLRDVPGMAAYARAHIERPRWGELVAILLDGPGSAGESSPRLEEPLQLSPPREQATLDGHSAPSAPSARLRAAARLVLILELDPKIYLDALPSGMALGEAAPLLDPLLCGRTHERRAAALRRAVLAARLANLVARRATLERGRVTVRDDTVCAECGVRIGERVFAMRPAGEKAPGRRGPPHVTCVRCASPA